MDKLKKLISSKQKLSIWGIILFVVLAFGSTSYVMDDEEEADKVAETEQAKDAKDSDKQDQQAKEEEEKRQAEEEAKKAEEQRQAEEAAKQAEEQRQAEEAAKQAEEQRQAEEAAKQAEEQRQAEDEAKQQSATPESYKNCTEMRKVYPNGVPSTHAAYASKHDRDGDGYACEK